LTSHCQAADNHSCLLDKHGLVPQILLLAGQATGRLQLSIAAQNQHKPTPNQQEPLSTAYSPFIRHPRPATEYRFHITFALDIFEYLSIPSWPITSARLSHHQLPHPKHSSELPSRHTIRDNTLHLDASPST
jgi:hypothetical protein